jgi:hypothetical protein
MAVPILCTSCGASNGLLAEECRQCGAAVSRSGNIGRARRPGTRVPSAAWETQPVPDIWRTVEAFQPERETINAHDFLKYALLLKAMRSRFEEEDGIVWFDDALFFLRGGYDFFCFLNLSSSMTMRGRIFGGLNHARAPSAKLTDWLARMVEEARARAATTVDIFVAEEINSGSSAHRTMNVVERGLASLPAGARVSVDFTYYLSCTDSAIFDSEKFKREVAAKRSISNGSVTIRNTFRLFKGPLLAYDEEAYSGLRTLSKGSDPTELYQPVRYRATTFHLVCPDTREEPLWCAPGENDLDNFAGVLTLSLLGVGGNVPYKIMAERIEKQKCVECKRLFAELRVSPSSWSDEML